MSVTTKEVPGGYELGDSLTGLLRRFPLWPIRSERQYDRATAVLQDLFGRPDLDADGRRYVEALTILVGDYERRAYPLDAGPATTPADAIRHLMEAHGMTPADLGRTLGSVSAASMILGGKRGVSKANAKRLAERFGVDAGLFL